MSVAEPAQAKKSQGSTAAGRRRSFPWRLVVGLIALAAVGTAVGLNWHRFIKKPESAAREANGPVAPKRVATRVVVATPKPGGLERTAIQPGSVHPFQYADLYAKVSGYLKEQTVDIGDAVKEGQVLAVIDVPELFAELEQAKAALAQANAKAVLASARIETAKAELKAAVANVEQAAADVGRYTALRDENYKIYMRYKGLRAQSAVEQKVVDEKQAAFESAIAAELASKAAEVTTKSKQVAAAAMVKQADAELVAAQADAAAAKADVDRAQVMAGYTKIISPYNGVVTLRTFNIGDFIRSAADLKGSPVLSVARTDLLRIVIQVPDRDVPFVDRGDPVTITMDALGNRAFHGTVSRFANSENPLDRTMRTEVDLKNEDDKLRPGMYGMATIVLEPASKNLSIPSSALIELSGNGTGSVFVARDGKARRVPVHVVKDDGHNIEISSGLAPTDEVIVRYNGALSDGEPIQTEAEPADSSK